MSLNAGLHFTGGEPFMNPEMIGLAGAALERGYDVLILTNAMRPMMRKRVQAGLIEFNTWFYPQLDKEGMLASGDSGGDSNSG